MRMNKRAGLSSVLAVGAIFFAGAYAQKCASVTELIPTERLESHADRVLGRDVRSSARRFTDALDDGIQGSEAFVSEAVNAGMMALPDSYRENAVRIGIGLLEDSVAYEVLRDRMNVRDVPYR